MFQPGSNHAARHRGEPVLTRLDATVQAGASPFRLHSTHMMARDMQILRLVAGFGQLTSAQLDVIVFHQNLSRDVCGRVLRRLTADKYLHRLNRRLPGGPKGGSPQYCYELGGEGWGMFNRGRWRPHSSVNYHDLAVVDAYIELLQASRAGVFDILQVVNVPHTHQTIASAEIRPDLYVELARGERHRHLYLETDLGSEHGKQIKDKLARYWKAYDGSNESEMSADSLVLFLVPSDERRAEIFRAIKSFCSDFADEIERFPPLLEPGERHFDAEDARQLFMVLLAEDYVRHLL